MDINQCKIKFFHILDTLLVEKTNELLDFAQFLQKQSLKKNNSALDKNSLIFQQQ